MKDIIYEMKKALIEKIDELNNKRGLLDRYRGKNYNVSYSFSDNPQLWIIAIVSISDSYITA